MLGLNSSSRPRAECLSICQSVCLSVSPCVGCGLSLKHGNAFTANNPMRRPGSTYCNTLHPNASRLTPPAFFFWMRECCCHLAKASHCKLATKWLRQMGYVIKCGYSNCMYASLHLVCVCVQRVCVFVYLWVFQFIQHCQPASQPGQSARPQDLTFIQLLLQPMLLLLLRSLLLPFCCTLMRYQPFYAARLPSRPPFFLASAPAASYCC